MWGPHFGAPPPPTGAFRAALTRSWIKELDPLEDLYNMRWELYNICKTERHRKAHHKNLILQQNLQFG